MDLAFSLSLKNGDSFKLVTNSRMGNAAPTARPSKEMDLPPPDYGKCYILVVWVSIVLGICVKVVEVVGCS